MKDMYFLTSRHGNCGTSVMFHNKDEHGYGTNLNELQLYTREEAQKYHNQYGRESLPLLAEKVIERSNLRVDCQYIDYKEGMPFRSEDMVIVIPSMYDGNDICFVGVDKSQTYDIDKARVFRYHDLPKLGCSRMPWSADYLKSRSRPTFQQGNINTRSMCRGVNLIKKKYHSRSGKERWNCPSCGKINWQYNPYDFEGCSDVFCSEYKCL